MHAAPAGSPTICADEHQFRGYYKTLLRSGETGYCLVALSIKNFSEYLHMVGQDRRVEIIDFCLERVASCLGEGEYLCHLHHDYFNLLLRCGVSLDELHPKAAAFHFAVRDPMEERFGRKLYLALGFYPLLQPDVDFYDAQYFADLSRKGFHYHFAETNYDMYGLSYIDHQEAFRKLEKSVQQALDHGDFKLYLQPKVDVRTGEVNSAEALVRWVDPEKGMIPLSDFLPHLEENGRIRDVDLYLFDQACGYLHRWLHTFGKQFSISFNLDRAYFNGTFFMPEYTATFGKYDIPPDCIRIELLESIVLDDLEHLTPLVKDIYDFGFSCALDDFGSGFSSFGVLTSTRLSELKIDRSLFRDVENPKERALIKHIVDIAHDMDMVTVAEGIETEGYAAYLKEIGCDFIQGFLYYRPMPVEEFEARFVRPYQEDRPPAN